MIERFSYGNRDDALSVMILTAKHLITRNQKMWDIEDLTQDKIFKSCDGKNIIIGYIKEKPVASMILLYCDHLFWPKIEKGTSGFIHKLSVTPEYKGKGLVKEMIVFAEQECKKKGIDSLRLDCAAERPKLCALYEQNGFRKVNERMVGPNPTAFYEKNI